MYKINAATVIGKVVLNVENLPLMRDFYQEMIGLAIKTETEDEVSFGIHGELEKELLILKKVTNFQSKVRATGLYHTAFLLPKRSDLGDILYHLLKANYPITGASDHGYSEAIYLDDPEGNGIEIYRDKPREFWDINPDGTINGITIEMDAEGVIGEATDSFIGMPVGTTVGHVHLTVADLEKTHEFYVNTLQLNLQTEFPNQAKFLAAGGYHHHIGTNVWSGRNIPPMEKGTRGLNYYTMLVPSTAALKEVEANLIEKNYQYTIDNQQIKLTDPNGIDLLIEVSQ